jgi:hypothetical protein
MPTEPPKAEPPKRKRRWFQFSLRSLMIVVTLLAVPLTTIRIMGPPWIEDSLGKRQIGGLTCVWLIIVAVEFYLVWIVMRFATWRPPATQP